MASMLKKGYEFRKEMSQCNKEIEAFENHK